MEAQEAFTSYKDLDNTDDYVQFTQLFTSIYALKKPFTPWVFICASSGTGKTQLAFSLPLPRLFFLMNYKKADNQPIYKPFERISKKLSALMGRDISKLNELERNASIQEECILPTHHIDDPFSCLSGSFILFLIEELRNNPQSQWLKNEVNTEFKSKKYPVNKIKELKERLNFLFLKTG